MSTAVQYHTQSNFHIIQAVVCKCVLCSWA